MRRWLVLFLTLLVSLSLAAPVRASDPLEYAALGDSYSAGSGNLPIAPGTSPFCAQSTRNFSHVIAGRIGADLTDVTCGGAQTKDFSKPQYPGVAPQLDAVGPETDLVTMTIGGNDAGTLLFAAGACALAGLTTLGFGNPCERAYGDLFERRVQNIVYPAVLEALRAVRAKAPDARVAIVGYPWLLPATHGCYARMPIARGDVPYLRSLQARLNGVIEQAAGQTAVTFVDMAVRSEGHDACQAPGVRWIEPVVPSGTFATIHPNVAGEAAMADAVMADLDLG